MNTASPQMNANQNLLTGPAASPVLITGAPKVGKSALLQLFHQIENFHVVDEPLSTWRIGIQKREDDCRYAEDATDTEIARVHTEIGNLLRNNEKSRYADVLSHHALQLPYLRAIFPDARVLMVTRHPREFVPESLYFWKLKPSVRHIIRTRWRKIRPSTVVALGSRYLRNLISSRRQGRLNTFGAIVPGQKEFADAHTVPELAAYQWAALYDVVFESSESWSQSVHFVSFEDLRNRPRETVEAVLRFCQIDATPQLLDYAADLFDPNFVSKKRIELSESEWESVWPLVRRPAERMGYKIPD